MAILDSKGRLFGKFNILDLGALFVIVLVLFGIFVYPGATGSVAQVGSAAKPVEVDVLVRGLSVRNADDLFNKTIKVGNQTNIIIRNQPHGSVDILAVKRLPRTVLAPQPDGSLKELSDLKSNSYSTDMLLTLGTQAQITKDGPVIGPSKVKIGVQIELDGFNYDFPGSVIDVRIKDKAA